MAMGHNYMSYFFNRDTILWFKYANKLKPTFKFTQRDTSLLTDCSFTAPMQALGVYLLN